MWTFIPAPCENERVSDKGGPEMTEKIARL